MNHTLDKSGSRAPRIVAYCAGALVVVVVLVIAFVSINTNVNVDSGARTDKIAACARQLRSDVDSTQADLNIATSQTVSASSRLSALNAQYLRAAETDNRAEQLEVLAESQDALDAVQDSAADLNESIPAFRDAVATYSESADLSYNDPDRFLALCKAAN